MTRALLLLVVAAGVALRWRGLDWGLPWALHIDERLFVAAKSIQLERSLSTGGIPDPGITSYGILPLWLVVAARKLFLAVAARPGPPTYGDDLAATILLARTISATAGTLAILATAAWARRWGTGISLTAAALAAGFPALVQASHYGTVETLLVLMIATTMLAAERAAEQPSRVRALVAGLAWGAALSVKAPAVFLAFPLLHATKRRFVVTAAAAAVVVLALNPGLARAPFVASEDEAAPEHETFLGNLRRAYSNDFHDWTLAYAKDIPVVTPMTRLFPYGAGIAACVGAAIGFVALARRRTPHDARLLLLLAPLLLVMLPARVNTIRFYLPMFPLLAILAACGASWFAMQVAPVKPHVRTALLAALAVVTLLHGAAVSSIYAAEDSRVAAAKWLDAHVGPREVVVVEDPPGYGPPLDARTPEMPRPVARSEILWRNFYVEHERRTDEERRAHLNAILGRADWIALSEGHRAEYEAAGALRPVETEFYTALDAGRLPFEKVATFKTYPHLCSVTLKDDGAEVLMRVFDHPRIDIWKRVAPRDSGGAAP